MVRKSASYGLSAIAAGLTVLLVFSPLASPRPVVIQTTMPQSNSGRDLELEKQHWIAERQARADRIQIYAPFWKIGQGFDSSLMINNTQPRSIDVEPIVYRDDGTAVKSRKIHLKELESQTVRLGDFIDVRQGHGQISLSFMGEPMDIAAQIVVADRQRSLSFNHVFMARSKLASSRLDGVFYLPDAGARSALALANISDEVVQVNVTFSAGREHAEKHRLVLAPHQTQLMNVNSLLPHPRHSTAIGIAVAYTGEGGRVLAQGMVSDEVGYSANMKIIDPVELKSSKLISPGLKLKSGLAPTLLLSNSSDNNSDVALIAHYNVGDEPYQTTLATVSVPPHEADSVDLQRQVDALPSDATDVGLELQQFRAGGLVADLLLMDASGSDVIQMTPKDSIDEAWVGHSLPYRIDGGLNTIVTIANPSDTETIMYCLFVFYEGGTYTYEGKWLKPGQVKHVDIKELRDRQVPGELGIVIPKNVEFGQVKIKIHGAAGADRAIAEVVISDAGGKISVTMSCVTCPSDPSNLTLSPTSVSGQIGDQSQNIIVTIYYWDRSFKVILSPWAVTWFPADSSIADNSPGTFKLDFKAPGTTSISAQSYDCHYEINWLSEQCECVSYVYVSSVSPIEVTVQTPTINCNQQVTRGNSMTAQLVNANNAINQNWMFSGGGGSAQKLGGNNWSGTMAVGGTITVTFTIRGQQYTRQCNVTVNNRNWHTNPASAMQVPNGTFATLPVPPQPTGDDSGLGVAKVDTGDTGFNVTIIGGGPNNGYLFYSTPLTMSPLSFRYEINPDLENQSSDFSQHQCGMGGIISWNDLITQTRRHEYNSSTQSHNAFYSTAMNSSANNPGDYFEARVAPNGTDATQFVNDTRTALNTRYDQIAAQSAAQGNPPVEPYPVNYSETGQPLGTINYAPYMSPCQ